VALTAKQDFKMPATVYSGVFDREYQVTVKLEDREINLTVSDDFVEFTAPPTDEGVAGFLKVDIVARDGDKFVIALPGEVQGAVSRVTADRKLLQVA
jgi:hypothetical protein